MRDYARKRERVTVKQPKKTQSKAPETPLKVPPGWLWIGGVIVLLVGVMLIHKGHHTSNPNAAAQSESVPTHASSQASNAKTDKPTAPAAPSFDFYNMLPSKNGGVVVQAVPSTVPSNSQTESATTENSASTDSSSSTAPAATQTTAEASNQMTSASQAVASVPASEFLVQVGSFANRNEAQAMRARLMLLGFEPGGAHMSGGKYHVDIGPLSSMQTAVNLRHSLQQEGIKSVAIRTVDVDHA